jgi:hypothetical protein
MYEMLKFVLRLVSLRIEKEIFMIYLAGPYTSQTRHEHTLNVGRLMTYKIYLNMLISDEFILCAPLQTAGFDHGVKEISDQDWLAKSQEAMKCCRKVYFTPEWKSSVGCNEELSLADELEMPVSFFGQLSRELQSRIHEHAKLIQDLNPLVWMADYYLNHHYLDDFSGRE